MGIVDQGSSVVDKLIGGVNVPLLTKKVVLAAGQGALARGTVLGKIILGAATKANNGAGAAGANTGNGTLALDETAPILAMAKAGIYTVKVIRAAVAQIGTTPAVPAQLGIAELRDPDGNVLEIFDIKGSTGVTIANQVKFVMTEGSTPFALGDGFKITIAAGSGEYKKVDKTAIDGSAVADCVLSEAADATSAVGVTAYKSGEFNSSALVVADGDTVAAHVDELRLKDIHVKAEVYA
jgi:hypothetical protein